MTWPAGNMQNMVYSPYPIVGQGRMLNVLECQGLQPYYFVCLESCQTICKIFLFLTLNICFHVQALIEDALSSCRMCYCRKLLRIQELAKLSYDVMRICNIDCIQSSRNRIGKITGYHIQCNENMRLNIELQDILSGMYMQYQSTPLCRGGEAGFNWFNTPAAIAIASSGRPGDYQHEMNVFHNYMSLPATRATFKA